MTAEDIAVVTFNINRNSGQITPNIPVGVTIGQLLMIGKILDLVTTELITTPQREARSAIEVARVLPKIGGH